MGVYWMLTTPKLCTGFRVRGGEGVGTDGGCSSVLTGVTQSGSPACLMAWHVERRRPFPRQIRETLKVEA